MKEQDSFRWFSFKPLPASTASSCRPDFNLFVRDNCSVVGVGPQVHRGGELDNEGRVRTMAAGDVSVLASNFSKTSEVVFGSMKKSLGRRPKCQCKHHQQKLLQKQEEQRQQLQAKLAMQGNRRTINPVIKNGKTDLNLFSLPICNQCD